MHIIFCTLIVILLPVFNVTASNSPSSSPTHNTWRSPSNSPISPINFDIVNEIAQMFESRTNELRRSLRCVSRTSREYVQQRQAIFNKSMNDASNYTEPLAQEDLTTRQSALSPNTRVMEQLIDITGDIDHKIQNADINELARMLLQDQRKSDALVTKLSNQNNTGLEGNNNHTVVGGVYSNVQETRLVDNSQFVETKDQSTSTDDLLVLENDLSDEGIENGGFEDEDFAEAANTISTTDSEEVAIEDSYINSPTTSANALNTEVLLEGVDETKTVALNNEINNINEKVTVQVHHVKAIIDVASASYAMPHNLIKNRLWDDYWVPIAVAAGDENKQGSTGIWASAGYSISRNFSNHLPYKSRMAVMTIGGDIALGDSSILGIAYSNAKANLKFNSLKGKSRINSHILSIYSQHDLQRNFYLQLVGSAASSTIRSKIEDENKKKSYVDNISLESNLPYLHSFSNGMQLLHTIGLKYNSLRVIVDKGQKVEKQTIIVNHKHERILSSHFGTKVIFNLIEFGSSLQLTPIMHAGLERRMTGGRKIIMASITTGTGVKGDVRVEMPRVVKNKYNLGVGLMAQSRNVKLQLDYNYSLQKSYNAHEAAIKLKINLGE